MPPIIKLVEEGKARARTLLQSNRFNEEGWQTRSMVRLLSVEKRLVLESDVQDLLFLLDRAEGRFSIDPPQSPQSGRDFALTASGLALQSRYREAKTFAEEATQRDPKLFIAWFLLATCHAHLGEPLMAEMTYDNCIAL